MILPSSCQRENKRVIPDLVDRGFQSTLTTSHQCPAGKLTQYALELVKLSAVRPVIQAAYMILNLKC
jgi:hypothetical protein